MAVLIAKLIRQTFKREENGFTMVTAKAGKDLVLLSFYHDVPKILKTVEYKLIGEWRKMRNGNMIFDAQRYEKIGSIKYTQRALKDRFND